MISIKPCPTLSPTFRENFKLIQFYVSAGLGTEPSSTKLQSLCSLDWLVMALMECKAGYFVDLASAEAVAGSNTWFLEQFAWDGVCIEVNQRLIFGYRHRNCSSYLAAAGSPTDRTSRFTFNNSVVIPGREKRALKDRQLEMLPLASLSDILAHAGAPNVIDYMSLDVNGAESNVVRIRRLVCYCFNASKTS
ncbi:unnamed protein product [Symbiodinium necroappetens]|uniref:Methyltransferase FkbM domain-containing protein n=1 Tax=Symbiodinium necroappetens TaxID=1628268 RepID=A0A813CH07_9DINO|nr:unnamed protein product [Symbiodinium sp. CCMP2456]CAE7942382.1 unnamed protein product [Symbiodinium necroappetens]